MKQPTSLGLALSGGGIKSFSQYPVLEWFDHQSVKIDYIAGTSMGSLIAALVSCGLSSEQLYDELLSLEAKVKDNKMIRPSLKVFSLFGDKIHGGLTDAEPFEEMLEVLFRKYGVVKLADVKIPLAINAVDVKSGKMVVFVSHPHLFQPKDPDWLIESDISLAKAVRCSCSYPLVFAACPYKDYACIDGGVRMNVPVPLVQSYQAKTVLAMTTLEELDSQLPTSLLSTAYRVTQIMGRENELANIKEADLVLNVPLTSDVIFKLGSGVEVFEQARQQLPAMIEAIEKLFETTQRRLSFFEKIKRRYEK